MVVLGILIVIGLVTLSAAVRLVWRAARGDIQIEPTSHGRQFFGRSEKNRDDSCADENGATAPWRSRAG